MSSVNKLTLREEIQVKQSELNIKIKIIKKKEKNKHTLAILDWTK